MLRSPTKPAPRVQALAICAAAAAHFGVSPRELALHPADGWAPGNDAASLALWLIRRRLPLFKHEAAVLFGVARIAAIDRSMADTEARLRADPLLAEALAGIERCLSGGTPAPAAPAAPAARPDLEEAFA